MLTRSSLSAEAVAALNAGDPAALIAHHRHTFGGFVMEDGGAGDGGTGDGGAGDQGAGDGGQGGDSGAGDGGQGDGTGENDNTGEDDKDPRVQRANRQAAQYRTQLRETQTQLQQLTEAQTANAGVLDALRKALTGESGEGEGETDPAVALQALTGEAETLRTEVSTLRGHLLVHELAADENANPTALLDSRRFTDTLAGLDPAAEDYRTKVADAIKDAVAKNTNLRAGQGSPRGGSEGAGGAGGDGTVTQEQFNAMDYKAKAQLFQTNPTLYRKLSGA